MEWQASAFVPSPLTAGSNRGLDATIGLDYSPGDVSRENVQNSTGPGARINCSFSAPVSAEPHRAFWFRVQQDSAKSFSEFRNVLLVARPLGF